MKRLLIAVPIALLVAAVGLTVMEATSDEPDRQVARYLEATGRGNEQAALGAWVIYQNGPPVRQGLIDGRIELTRALVSSRVGTAYTIRSTDWWTTCCDPQRVKDAHNAGLARVHVTANDQAGQAHELIFEVFARKVIWWGDAGGDTRHEWTLYEVHRDGEPCQFLSPVGCYRQ